MTSRIPYKGTYVVKSQLVEQNDPLHEIAEIFLRLDSNRSRNNRYIFRLLRPLQSIARSELENCHESVTNKNREGAETSASEN